LTHIDECLCIALYRHLDAELTFVFVDDFAGCVGNHQRNHRRGDDGEDNRP
jgi:hypothetical protein